MAERPINLSLDSKYDRAKVNAFKIPKGVFVENQHFIGSSLGQIGSQHGTEQGKQDLIKLLKEADPAYDVRKSCYNYKGTSLEALKSFLYDVIQKRLN